MPAGHGRHFAVALSLGAYDPGWHGVPHREMVFVQPTVNCLVNLTEMPFFVVEIECMCAVSEPALSERGQAQCRQLKAKAAKLLLQYALRHGSLPFERA